MTPTTHSQIEAAIACFEEIIAQDDQHAYTARVGLEALRTELTRPQEVAVGEVNSKAPGGRRFVGYTYKFIDLPDGTKLYTAPPSTAPAQSQDHLTVAESSGVPDGFFGKIVDAMRKEDWENWDCQMTQDHYAALARVAFIVADKPNAGRANSNAWGNELLDKYGLLTRSSNNIHAGRADLIDSNACAIAAQIFPAPPGGAGGGVGAGKCYCDHHEHCSVCQPSLWLQKSITTTTAAEQGDAKP